MSNYKTPGVYVEEISKFPPSVAGVATAIPAFIGFTEKNPNGTNVPVKVKSLVEYEEKFGKGNSLSVDNDNVKGYEFSMYDSMRLFYDNGGGVCYVVSVGDYSASDIDAETYKSAFKPLEKVDEVTLVVCPDAAPVLNAKVTDNAVAQLGTLHQAMLQHCAEMGDRFAILDPMQNDDLDTAMLNFRNNVGSKNLSYGAAYYPYVKTTYTKEISFDEMHEESSLKTIIETKPLYKTYTNVSTGNDEKKLIAKAIAAQIPEYASKLKEFQNKASIIPVSAAIAGIYSAVDATKGVWQAPANISLSAVSAVTEQMSDKDQENLNVDTTAGKSVNAIRFFNGKGILVWGARTLDGNSNEWRYIPVRRLFNYVEESVQKSTAWAVFQPNDANTWVKVQSQIENFLSNLWRDGALAGSTPDKAFYVKVGLDVTMTTDDINNGYMIIEIGMAAVRPAEFVVLQFSHKLQEA